jgi:hypothetical protein
METNQAAEHLQVIRTLMERSALYRRALAPIMLVSGTLGAAAAAVGLVWKVESPKVFVGLWFSTAGLALTGAFLLARRQALKDSEPFWSSPTKRVTHALLPPLICGMFVGVLFSVIDTNWTINFALSLAWMLFYGCALWSAGFFMTRGMKWFGILFIGSAIALALTLLLLNATLRPQSAILVMGFFFGILHLAYGIYLYFTENRNTAP